MKLSSGNTLTINATPNHPQQLFVQETTRNQNLQEKLFFTHEELAAGGNIDFKLGIVPNPKEHTPDKLPFSLSAAK